MMVHKASRSISLTISNQPDVVVRVNYEKCAVNLRNRRLVQAAIDVYGETTGHVYGVVLKQLTKNLARCHQDPQMDIGDMAEDEDVQPATSVRTYDILDNIKTSVDLSFGIGKAAPRDISKKAAEQIQQKAASLAQLAIPEAEVEGDASSDEEDGDSDGSSDPGDDDFTMGHETKTNGAPDSKVKFADSAGLKEDPQPDRPTQLRQHLLLLSESDQGFIRHCGPQEWTVDFPNLVRRLMEDELDAHDRAHLRTSGPPTCADPPEEWQAGRENPSARRAPHQARGSA